MIALLLEPTGQLRSAQLIRALLHERALGLIEKDQSMTIIRKALGCGVFAAGTLILAVSAKFSYEGFAGTFDTIPAAGWVGVGFAVLAFLTASAVRIFRDDEDGHMRATAVALLAIACIGDVAGNWQAMDLQTVSASQADQDRLAAYDAAAAALPRVEAELDQLNADLAIVSGPDIGAAQRLLKSTGDYSGRLDGLAGGATEAAMLAFGTSARARIQILQDESARLMAVKATGKPVAKANVRNALNVALALFLTISSGFASAIGTRLLMGADELDEIRASQEAKSASAEILEMFGQAA